MLLGGGLLILALGKAYYVERVASGLSWYASEVYQAQCLGMKTVGMTGVPAKHFLQYAPSLSKLPHEAQLDFRRQAIIELQQKGILRKDVPPVERLPGIVIQDAAATDFGQQLCAYYFIRKNPHHNSKPQNP